MNRAFTINSYWWKSHKGVEFFFSYFFSGLFSQYTQYEPRTDRPHIRAHAVQNLGEYRLPLPTRASPRFHLSLYPLSPIPSPKPFLFPRGDCDHLTNLCLQKEGQNRFAFCGRNVDPPLCICFVGPFLLWFVPING